MTNGNDIPSRIQRLEEFIEVLTNDRIELRQELKQLLTAQVVMQDEMKQGFAKLTAAMTTLAESQRASDERLNALIAVVDGIIKKPPPPAA